MTPAGLGMLVRMASAEHHSEIRSDARRILLDTAVLWAVIILTPFATVGAALLLGKVL